MILSTTLDPWDAGRARPPSALVVCVCMYVL